MRFPRGWASREYVSPSLLQDSHPVPPSLLLWHRQYHSDNCQPLRQTPGHAAASENSAAGPAASRSPSQDPPLRQAATGVALSRTALSDLLDWTHSSPENATTMPVTV